MKKNIFIIMMLVAVLLITAAGCRKKDEPLKGTWVQLKDFPGNARDGAVSFVIGKYGYICTGHDKYNCLRDVWQYDSETDTWTQKNQFPGTERSGAVAFTIGNKGYIGLGSNGTYYMNDFWEYDPDTDTWTEKASYPGSGREGVYAFGIDGKGYAGCGFDDHYLNDFYKYDPVNDQWSQIATILGDKRAGGNTFVYDGKGFVFGGEYNWEPITEFDLFNPSIGNWMALNKTTNYTSGSFDNSYTDLARESGVMFLIGDYAYVSLGLISSRLIQSTWQYDIKNDLWQRVADFPSEGFSDAACFSFDGYGIVAGGRNGNVYNSEVWKFVPDAPTD